MCHVLNPGSKETQTETKTEHTFMAECANDIAFIIIQWYIIVISG